MTAATFVDTNVLVYSLDAGAGPKHQRAREWITLAWESRTGRLSVQVLQELYVTLTRKLRPGLAPSAARAEVRALFPWLPVNTRSGLIESAWKLQDRFALSWWDALIVAAAQAAECRYRLSEDLQDGQEFHGMQVINPFAHAPGSM